MRRRWVLVPLFCLGAAPCGTPAGEGVPQLAATQLRSDRDLSCPATVAGAPVGLLLRVEKSALRLGVYRDGRLVGEGTPSAPTTFACFPVALGGQPVGDKVLRGDERTPEGVYRVTHRNPGSAYHLSLGLNYPTARHADAALAAGVIDRRTHDRIVASDRPGRMPVRDSALGGDIYLHGGGDSPRDWTDGCVGMANSAIEQVYALADPGTPVWIVP